MIISLFKALFFLAVKYAAVFDGEEGMKPGLKRVFV